MVKMPESTTGLPSQVAGSNCQERTRRRASLSRLGWPWGSVLASWTRPSAQMTKWRGAGIGGLRHGDADGAAELFALVKDLRIGRSEGHKVYGRVQERRGLVFFHAQLAVQILPDLMWKPDSAYLKVIRVFNEFPADGLDKQGAAF